MSRSEGIHRTEGLSLQDMLILVRGGWDLDALGKFFRLSRRHRPRLRIPLLLNWILIKSRLVHSFAMEKHFRIFCFEKVVFRKKKEENASFEKKVTFSKLHLENTVFLFLTIYVFLKKLSRMAQNRSGMVP